MKIDVWSDVACPFCYIGITQLEKALEQLDIESEVTFHSFELDPGSPKETDRSLQDILAEKYDMTPAQAWETNARVAEMAEAEGLEFNMSKAKPVNTFDAHRLIHLASAQGRQAEMKKRLLRAYFTDGKSVSNHDVLVELATEVGLDAEEVRGMLAGDKYQQEVRADISEAAKCGARGVPFFVINEKFTFSGAQGVEGFKNILQSIPKEE